jgi:hypothetical protein
MAQVFRIYVPARPVPENREVYPWFPTKVPVRSDQLCSIRVIAGQWRLEPDKPGFGPEGISSALAQDAMVLMRGRPLGGLIGRIESLKFWVGGEGQAPQGTGELLLAMNDRLPCYADHAGELLVEVRLEPAPPRVPQKKVAILIPGLS